MILGHIDPKTGKWTKGPPKARASHEAAIHARAEMGLSLQFPKDWDDGSGQIRHVKSGPNKGRVCWTSHREAKELVARYNGMCSDKARWNPN